MKNDLSISDALIAPTDQLANLQIRNRRKFVLLISLDKCKLILRVRMAGEADAEGEEQKNEEEFPRYCMRSKERGHSIPFWQLCDPSMKNEKCLCTRIREGGEGI